MTEDANALVEPPEGAIVGESVPTENEREDFEYREAIEAMVGVLKTRPAYRGRSDDELVEIAQQKLGL